MVPAFVEADRDRADERLDARRRLEVGRTEPPSLLVAIHNLHLETEVLLHLQSQAQGQNGWPPRSDISLPGKLAYILENDNEEGHFDGEGLFIVNRARDVIRRHVRPHQLVHLRLDVFVDDAAEVAVLNILVPDSHRLLPV